MLEHSIPIPILPHDSQSPAKGHLDRRAIRAVPVIFADGRGHAVPAGFELSCHRQSPLDSVRYLRTPFGIGRVDLGRIS